MTRETDQPFISLNGTQPCAIQLKKAYFGQEPGKRVDVDEAHAKHLIEQGIAEPVPGEPLSPLIEKAMSNAVEKLSEGMNAAIAAALKQVAEAQGLAKKHAMPVLFGPGGRATRRRTSATGCLHVARGDEPIWRSTTARASSSTAKAAMAEASGVTGGYVVPPEFYQGIMDLVAEETFFRQRAFVQPMASATLQFPYLDITTVQSAGMSPFFGGVQMNWTEEAQNRTETEPQFKMMELKAHELSGYAVSSNVLLQDAAFGLEQFLMTLFAGPSPGTRSTPSCRATAWASRWASSTPRPCPVKRSSVEQRSSSWTWRRCCRKLLPSARSGPIWVMHPYVLPQLVQLADAGRPHHLGAEQRRPAGQGAGHAVRPAGPHHREGAGARHQGRRHADRSAACTSSATACRSRSRPANTSTSSRTR